MSLLPEFNEKFNYTLDAMAPLGALSVSVLRDLLNPNLNPLTFEEVKAWFDWKVSERECMYHGVCSDGSYRYEIFLAKHYFIHQDGYARVSKIRPLENRISFSNLLNELSSNPLYTFCQMKGYVDL
jgi:hypothetical protein